MNMDKFFSIVGLCAVIDLPWVSKSSYAEDEEPLVMRKNREAMSVKDNGVLEKREIDRKTVVMQPSRHQVNKQSVSKMSVKKK